MISIQNLRGNVKYEDFGRRNDFTARRNTKVFRLSETFAGTSKVSRSGNTRVEQEEHSLN